jgi:proton glutamate symport protein
MSKAGIDIIGALLKLIVFLYIASFLMIALYSIVIWRCSGTSFAQSLFAFKETLLVAIGTSNSFAAIPSALNALHSNLNFEKETADLIIPLGINLNPHGSILHFALTAMFMSQLYEKSLGAGDISTTIIIVIIAAVASAGVPGIAALSMLVLILEPLGLPVVISMILLTAIDPIVDPILTVVNVYGNCATTAIITKRHLHLSPDYP